MSRRLCAATPAVAAVAFAWAVTATKPNWALQAAVTAAVLLATLPRTLRSRCAAAGVITIGVLLAVVVRAPGAIDHTIRQGLRDTYAVEAPFDADANPELYALVVLAAALFGLVIATTAGTRPFPAAVVTVIGIGWPTTIHPTRNTVAMGVLALLVAFWPVVVSGARDRRALVAGTVALACIATTAALAAGAGARPAAASFDWRSWTPFGATRASETVALVWDSNYAGIDFPAKKTTVLRIAAPRRGLYWRATTLDSFAGDRWIEALYGTALVAGGAKLPRDALLPAEAAAEPGWVEQQVEVHALVDDHVVAAAQPMRFAADSDRPVLALSGGVLRTPHGPTRIRRYTVWSYAPQPTPEALVRSRPDYPPVLDRYLDIGRTVAPAFGAPGRVATVDTVFANDLYRQFWPYEAVWREAGRLTANADSPYEATIAIERWLRSGGGFTYDEHPPASAELPPLIAFLTRTKRGYCQQFAGSMALMLRYLGIPARVAVGFTSGTWKDDGWTVTDHDAHAWVEAWFAGHGWLAFDPTPGRGTLTATYTHASDSADAIQALGSGRFLDLAALEPVDPSGGAAPVAEAERRVRWALVLPAATIVVALLALAATKATRRRRRYAANDPRTRAAAARAELVAFIRDQGVQVAVTASVPDLAVELRRFGVGSDAFARAFLRARYGPPGDAAVAAADTRRELRRLLALLRSSLGPARRIRGFFAVRSLHGR